jgi:CubicO group peptidase (beta-lactamase class C family)
MMVLLPVSGLPSSMRKLALTSIAAATLCLCVPLRAQELVFDRFGDYLDSLRAQIGIPGLTAAIVGVNGITWERPFGYSNVERLVGTRADTPYHVDGLTQTLTAALVLRCVEEGRLSLDSRAGDATIRQLLSHTSGSADAPQFLYRPDRLAPLADAVSGCTGQSFRASMIDFLERNLMFDAVPGPDAVGPRYASILDRLATPYAVNAQRRPSPSHYPATTLTPSAGLIATTRDFAQFDLALKRRTFLRPEMIALAWSNPVTPTGQLLPHGLGWFVQSYNGEPIVWQFGLGENASSSMMIILPRRAMTLILLANSDGLVNPLPLAAGDVLVSPFAKLFVGLFTR